VSIADPGESNRLILQIQRDLVAQARLKSLWTAAATTLAGHRRELRTVERRLARAMSPRAPINAKMRRSAPQRRCLPSVRTHWPLTIVALSRRRLSVNPRPG